MVIVRLGLDRRTVAFSCLSGGLDLLAVGVQGFQLHGQFLLHETQVRA